MTDKNSIDYPMSGADIKRFFDNKIKIIIYSDIDEIDSLDELLVPYDRTVILFETFGPSVGHWTCIFKIPNTNKVIFFDSYGLLMENELNYIPFSIKKLTDARKGYLLRLLHQPKYDIYYSQYRLQKLSNSVATCGKWVCQRLLYQYLNENEFAQPFLEQKKKGLSPDIIVNELMRNTF